MVAWRPGPGEVSLRIRPRLISCSSARSMHSLLMWWLKRLLICVWLRPWGFTSRAWLIQLAVGSMGAVSKKRRASAAVVPYGQGAEITAVPGVAQQRRELSGFAAKEVEDGGE